jgi:cellulose synthase/poly-beta-1,6-N-acetylglucosamine synthase-like glycosyltransferase
MAFVETFDIVLLILSPVILIQMVLVLQGTQKIKSIQSVNLKPQLENQKLSVIIAARDEALSLPKTLEHLHRIPGDWIEFIFINDRSRDNTGEVIAAMAQLDDRFRQINIEHLPEGWLGKNHALHRGAQISKHPWILFSDADVLHSEETLRRAVLHAETQRLDFFTLLIDINSRSKLVQLFISFFAFAFTSYFRPWLTSDPKSKQAVGIGAFNLVRKEFYLKHDGHTKIAMRPDDDVRLARHFKENGGKLDLMMDIKSTSVEWYSSLPEAARGLEKNSLAGLDYSYFIWAGSLVACTLLFIVAPLWGIITLSPIGLCYYLGTSGCAAVASWQRQQPIYYALAYPLAAALFVGIVFRAGVLTMWRGGIYWRGHFYSLSELRKS